MNVTLKISAELLGQVRSDLVRPHAFAHERVGFLLAGAAAISGGLMLTVRGYQAVADADYEFAPGIGARIGSNAMRKAAQAAYRPRSTILHVHTHGGRGVPRFSGVDLESANEFVPAFFHSAPRMPHGLLVLSDTDAFGLLWVAPDQPPIDISKMVSVGIPLINCWSGRHELA